MPSKLLQEVADYCWSKNFLDVFRNFFTEHGAVFEDAPALTGGEHNMKYYNLFQVYLKLYETTLVTYLNTLDVSIEEFYRDVRDAQEETTDPYLQTFIDCLLASADYESFYKVMSREGQKHASRRALSSSAKKPSSGTLSTDADAKAEAKNSPVRSYEAKGRPVEADRAEPSDAKYSHK